MDVGQYMKLSWFMLLNHGSHGLDALNHWHVIGGFRRLLYNMAAVRDYHHPYTPYNIQVDLMNAIYDCITDGKVGIFESPTGTGKTLSLICGSLTWLRNVQDDISLTHAPLEASNDEPDWVIEHAQVERRKALLERRVEFERRLREIRTKEDRHKHNTQNKMPNSKRRKADSSSLPRYEDIDSFALDEYVSDEERPTTKRDSQMAEGPGISAANMEMMEKLGLIVKAPSVDEDLDSLDEMKVYFCSRTHSQLSQLVQEIRRLRLPTACGPTGEEDWPGDSPLAISPVKTISLGSRKHLCINHDVSRLGNVSAVNERCLELQKPETPKDHRCPFLPSKENDALLNDFRDHSLAKIRDIEELGSLGKKMGICPYYASRASVKPSEVSALISLITQLSDLDRHIAIPFVVTEVVSRGSRHISQRSRSYH